MTWEEFLRYLTDPGGVSVAVGILLSLLAGYVAWYESLAAKWKVAVFFIACEAVPLAAAGLGVLTLAWDPSWAATFWPAVVAGFMAWVSGTALHKKVRRGT